MERGSLIGKRYGRLTIVENITDKPKHTLVRCVCDCGKEWTGRASSLKNGNTQSCGCLKKETTIENHKKHGKSGTKIYGLWAGMLQRCENPKRDNYKWYGLRGIKVCAEWHQFEKFYHWAITNGYEDTLEIDRIDSNGHYEPDNCRWVTRKENNRNTLNNHFVEINGVTKTIGEWAEISGIRAGTILQRIKLGWLGNKILMPSREKKQTARGNPGF
jgi:hypothetical protein